MVFAPLGPIDKTNDAPRVLFTFESICYQLNEFSLLPSGWFWHTNTIANMGASHTHIPRIHSRRIALSAVGRRAAHDNAQRVCVCVGARVCVRKYVRIVIDEIQHGLMSVWAASAVDFQIN